MRHDIRTPFSGILSLARVLAPDEMDVQKREYLTQIANLSEELLVYLSEILEFTQLEQDKKKLILKIGVEDTGVGIPLEK